MQRAQVEEGLRLLPGQRVHVLSAPVYFDHEGNPVFCDWEGEGQFFDISTEAAIFADGCEVQERSGFFSKRLLVTHPANNKVTGIVTSTNGRALAEKFRSEEAPELVPQALGSGWLMGAARCRLDGGLMCRHAPGSAFFFSIEAEPPETLKLVRAQRQTRIERLCSVAVGDTASERAVEWNVNRFTQPVLVEGVTCIGCLSAMTFMVTVPDWATGISLRRTFDGFHGMQRARVRIGTEVAGIWFQPHRHRPERLSEDMFSTRLIGGQAGTTLRVMIEPSAGSPLWNVGKMEVHALG